jgi:hypothetical protein
MNRLKVALIVVGVALVFIIGLVLGGVVGRMMPQSSMPFIANTATVVRQVQALNELVTIRFVMEKVVVLEDAKWYGDNRVTIVAHGTVKAGFDLQKVQPGDISISDRKIRLVLPPAMVTDAYLNDRETQVLERTTGVMRVFDKTLEQEARKQAVGQLIVGAKKAGILLEAQDRAKMQLQALLLEAGFDAVDVEFKTDFSPLR